MRTSLGVRFTLFTDQVTTFQRKIQKQQEKRFEPAIFWSETLLSNATCHGVILNVSSRVDWITACCTCKKLVRRRQYEDSLLLLDLPLKKSSTIWMLRIVYQYIVLQILM